MHSILRRGSTNSKSLILKQLIIDSLAQSSSNKVVLKIETILANTKLFKQDNFRARLDLLK